MRTIYRRWEDESQESWPVPGGTATLLWSFLGGDRIRIGERALPKQFTYVERPDDERLPMYLVECSHTEDGVPIVEAVHVVHRPPNGRDVRQSDLRNLRPLEDVIEEAWTRVRLPWQEVGDLSAEHLQAVGASRAQDRKLLRGLRAQNRRKVTPKLLAEVSQVYRDHAADGAPTKAVAEHFGVASSTASLYVRRARDAGLDMGGET